MSNAVAVHHAPPRVAAISAPRTSLASAAPAYARCGRQVFPLKPRAKTPLTPHGFKDATSNLAQVEAWWRQWPEANIGCATGARSRFWSLDVDGDDGEATLRKLEAEHGQLPPSIEIITGHGRQRFFRYLEPVANSVRKLGDGLDVRGDGGYTILPPSIHPTGKQYEWSVDGYPGEVPLAAAPDWLVAAVRSPNPARASNGQAENWRALTGRRVPEGQRNDRVARLTGLLLRKLDTPEGPYVAMELIRAWNLTHCDPPLPDDEIERTVESIAAAEMRRRMA